MASLVTPILYEDQTTPVAGRTGITGVVFPQETVTATPTSATINLVQDGNGQVVVTSGAIVTGVKYVLWLFEPTADDAQAYRGSFRLTGIDLGVGVAILLEDNVTELLQEDGTGLIETEG